MCKQEVKTNTSIKKKKIEKFFRYINRIFDIFAIVISVGLFATVIIQIAGRSIGRPAPWTEEGARFLFLWMVFLGMGMGFRKSESARVTILIDRLPKSMKKISTGVYTLFSIGFFLFMFIYGLGLVAQQINVKEMGSALMIPMWIVGASVPIGAVLGILGVIENLLFHPELIDGGE